MKGIFLAALKKLSCALLAGGLLFAFAANAEEVRVGHLESNDDIGINWLFFNCEKSSDRLRLTCNMFQTLIMKAKTEAQVAEELQRQLSWDALAEFKKEFGSGCEQINANAKRIDQVIASGQDINGKPLNSRLTAPGLSAMKAIMEACQNPTQEAARRLFTATAKQQLRTCKVHSSYWRSVYLFNSKTNSSQEGPKGPCGVTDGSCEFSLVLALSGSNQPLEPPAFVLSFCTASRPRTKPFDTQLSYSAASTARSWSTARSSARASPPNSSITASTSASSGMSQDTHES
jgi:hypothetical protein